MREPEERNVTFHPLTTSEMPDAVHWWAEKESAHRLSLRNTGRIEQLEAGHQDLKEFVTAILRAAASKATYKRTLWKWDSPTDIEGLRQVSVHLGLHGPSLVIGTCEGARGEWVTDIRRCWVGRTHYSVHSWGKSVGRLAIKGVMRQLAETETPDAEIFSEVARIYSELKEDFEDVGLRIGRCALLEEALGALEDELEGEDTEYVSWCVSLFRDVLDYNYAEALSEKGLDILGRGIEMICTTRLSCDREYYRELHKEFLSAGLALLPTSQKAQEKYGWEEGGDGGQELLFS